MPTTRSYTQQYNQEIQERNRKIQEASQTIQKDLKSRQHRLNALYLVRLHLVLNFESEEEFQRFFGHNLDNTSEELLAKLSYLNYLVDDECLAKPYSTYLFKKHCYAIGALHRCNDCGLPQGTYCENEQAIDDSSSD